MPLPDRYYGVHLCSCCATYWTARHMTSTTCDLCALATLLFWGSEPLPRIPWKLGVG